MSLHRIEKLLRHKLIPGVGYCCDKPEHDVYQKNGRFQQKIMGIWSRKSVKCCKQDLTDHTSRILEDNTAENCMDYESPAQEVSERNNTRKQAGNRTFL